MASNAKGSKAGKRGSHSDFGVIPSKGLDANAIADPVLGGPALGTGGPSL